MKLYPNVCTRAPNSFDLPRSLDRVSTRLLETSTVLSQCIFSDETHFVTRNQFLSRSFSVEVGLLIHESGVRRGRTTRRSVPMDNQFGLVFHLPFLLVCNFGMFTNGPRLVLTFHLELYFSL